MSVPRKPLILLGNINSYFSAKVRAYLYWKGLHFEEVHPDGEMYRHYIMQIVGVAQIPVLVDQERGENVFDTSLIIDYCEKWYPNTGRDFPLHPKGEIQTFFGFLLETFADEWMKLPAMHYRWSFPEQRPFLIRDWMMLLDPTGTEISPIVSKSMSSLNGVLPMLGVTPSTFTAIEVTYERLLSAMSDHFLKYDFIFGSKPTLADYSFAGPMHAHLFRDPVPGKLMKINHPRVAQWIERLVGHSKQRRGEHKWTSKNGKLEQIVSPVQSDDDFIGDSIPSNLTEIMKIFFEEFVPNLVDIQKKLDLFISSKKKIADGSSAIPRLIGRTTITVNGATGPCAVMPFSLWKLQRASTFLNGAGVSKDKVVNYYESKFSTGKDLTTVLKQTPKLYLYRGTKLFLREQPSLLTPKL